MIISIILLSIVILTLVILWCTQNIISVFNAAEDRIKWEVRRESTRLEKIICEHLDVIDKDIAPISGKVNSIAIYSSALFEALQSKLQKKKEAKK